jgi:hypothetical protein
MKIKTNLYQTCGINNAIESCSVFAGEIFAAIDKYLRCDWGDTCKSDQELNNLSLKDGSRILAKYCTSKGDVFIITEVDRSITTVLFASEY